ncbi:hypothetical protein [Gracilibacillus sp. YIM 98692]|uniref:hypothetical protein n=1 Tax=Gracilibacillus sp. YIM 98692 TaxID=2663532 RepID=UPI0013CFCDCA|nr:hypothetical protein [Gracilibacillus sp. YIM 98692]
MSRHHYDLCCRNIGRPAKIVTHDGQVHRGIIRRVSPSRVFLEPIGGRRNLGGYGIGFFGYGAGLGIGIALGAIATIAFSPFFFW